VRIKIRKSNGGEAPVSMDICDIDRI
jgi:hypothetical protein